jgi:hypothetical protein
MLLKFGIIVALIAGVVSGQCTSSGIDIQDGGTYFIGSSSASFSFITTFSGCTSSSFIPTLSGPGGVTVSCSALDPSASGQQESTWYFPIN